VWIGPAEEQPTPGDERAKQKQPEKQGNQDDGDQREVSPERKREEGRIRSSIIEDGGGMTMQRAIASAGFGTATVNKLLIACRLSGVILSQPSVALLRRSL